MNIHNNITANCYVGSAAPARHESFQFTDMISDRNDDRMDTNLTANVIQNKQI